MDLLRTKPSEMMPKCFTAQKRKAFTLVEMLMVLVIIGLIISIALPGIKGLKRSNVEANANRQLLDDLALARQRAIVGRTVVRMVFVPAEIMTMNVSSADMKLAERLKTGQFASYALFTERSLGDQPGSQNYKYITTWKTLPESIFIRTNEFNYEDPNDWRLDDNDRRPLLQVSLPFPSINGSSNMVPQIAFGPHGGLVDDKGNRVVGYEVIELTKGSIFFDRDSQGRITGIDMKELSLNYGALNKNWIVIDGLTGRAKLERQEIQ